VFQVPRQRPQRGQRGRAGPVQVIQAHQDRSRRGPLFEVRSDLGHPPRSRSRQATTGIIGAELRGWLAQGRAQREERDRLAQLVRCPRGQGKTQLRRLIGGVAEQQGLADSRLPVHQHQAARPPLSTSQQVTDDLLFGLTSVQHLPAGRPLPPRYPPARFRGGVTGHRPHVTVTAPSQSSTRSQRAAADGPPATRRHPRLRRALALAPAPRMPRRPTCASSITEPVWLSARRVSEVANTHSTTHCPVLPRGRAPGRRGAAKRPSPPGCDAATQAAT